MNSKLLALLGVVTVAVVAAGTGAFIAVRLNQNPGPPAAHVQETLAPAAQSEGVNETEAVLVLEPNASGPSPASSDPPKATSVPAPRPSATGARAQTRPVPARTPARTAPAPDPVAIESAASVPPSVPVEPTLTAGPIEFPASGRIEPVAMPAPLPPGPEYEDLVIPADAVIGLQIENNVSSETAAIEDRVDARVTRDVRAGGLVAIPAGSTVEGSVTLVEKGGKVKERARLGVRFHTLVLADGSRVPIQTETILREGDSPTGESAAKIGGAAVGGAILGAILGGGKGAAIGGSVGAAGGTAAVMAGSRNAATLQAGSTVTARLSAPATVTVEK